MKTALGISTPTRSAPSFESHQPIDRAKLYEEVWTTPFTKLGPLYGYSDAGLRKVCIALEVPIPSVGHWAKIAARQIVKRPPLRDQEGREIRYRKDPRLLAANSKDTRSADLEWLAKMEEQEHALLAAPKAELKVPPVIFELEAALQRSRKKAPYELARLIAEDRKRKKPNKWEPNWDAFGWPRAAATMNMLGEHDDKALRVSDTGSEAALEIIRQFVLEALRRGAAVKSAPKGPNVQIGLADYAFLATVRERFDEGKIKREFSGTEYATQVGTGEFVLVIDGIGSSLKEFRGNRESLLAAISADTVFLALYRRMMYCKQHARVEAARRQVWEEERRESERLQVIAQAEDQARKDEAKRREHLAEEAALWGRVVQLRGYVAAVRAAAGSTATQDLLDWFFWADKVIDEIDPIKDRTRAIEKSLPE